MKKLITALLCLLLTLAMVLTLVACDGDTKKKRRSSKDDDDDDDGEKTSQNGDTDDEDGYDYDDGYEIGNTDEPFNTQNKQTRTYPGATKTATATRVDYAEDDSYDDYDTPSYDVEEEYYY